MHLPYPLFKWGRFISAEMLFVDRISVSVSLEAFLDYCRLFNVLKLIWSQLAFLDKEQRVTQSTGSSSTSQGTVKEKSQHT